MKYIRVSFIALLKGFVAARAQASDLAISFAYPTNGGVFQSPNYLQVIATESSNTIVSAEFFANGQSIGVATNDIFYLNTPNYPGSIGVTATRISISANPGIPLNAR